MASRTWRTGLDRTDTITGPGARDAQWHGLLARVGSRGVRVCRPRIDRRKWSLLYPEFTQWATRLRSRCGGQRLNAGDGPAEYVTRLEVWAARVGDGPAS